jgi:hypothetical protein
MNAPMPNNFDAIVSRASGATAALRGEVIQSLWSGYGEIVRYRLHGADRNTVIVKHVRFPGEVNHPRGWHHDHAHQRKVRSYQVEMAWYHDWASRCDQHCRVPRCLASETINQQHLMVLEDLDAAGFGARRERLRPAQVLPCLRWLAYFHARFLGEAPSGLWPIGSYWHLATRQAEWQAIEDPQLRQAAPALDAMLNNGRFQTIIHGDAKVENFCFNQDGTHVAAVDFQYVGAGCGMKDLAYFLGSCLTEEEQQDHEQELLAQYFQLLQQALQHYRKADNFAELEQEWRRLYPIAQADFYRFLVGWSPGHWKLHDYSQRLAMKVVRQLPSI